MLQKMSMRSYIRRLTIKRQTWTLFGVNMLQWYIQAPNISMIHPKPKTYSERLRIPTGTKAGTEWLLLEMLILCRSQVEGNHIKKSTRNPTWPLNPNDYVTKDVTKDVTKVINDTRGRKPHQKLLYKRISHGITSRKKYVQEQNQNWKNNATNGSKMVPNVYSWSIVDAYPTESSITICH